MDYEDFKYMNDDVHVRVEVAIVEVGQILLLLVILHLQTPTSSILVGLKTKSHCRVWFFSGWAFQSCEMVDWAFESGEIVDCIDNLGSWG